MSVQGLVSALLDSCEITLVDKPEEVSILFPFAHTFFELFSFQPVR